MKKKTIGILLSLLTVGSVAAMLMANAQQDAISTPMVSTVKYQYAAKFVCGIQQNSAGTFGPVVPGVYMTAINIHNPQNVNISLTKKVVLALSEDQTPRPPSPRKGYSILPDYAFEIDCQDIMKIGQIPGPFAKGFVVIETPKQLDVVGVYTSTNLMMNNTDMEVVPVTAKAILPSTSITAAEIPPE